jgi:PAS domain S-box-containing protein
VIVAQKTILVVEDDDVFAEYLNTALSEQGYAVFGPVSTGKDAIDQARAQKLDLILMDISLSGTMNGIAAADHIRSFSDVPIIYLTGNFHDPILDQAKVTAPYGYLVKPVLRQELVATIEMTFYRHTLDMKLKASEERLSLALSSSRTVVWEWRAATNEMVWSPESEEFLGLKEFGKTFESFTSIFHPEDAPRVIAVIRQLSIESPVFNEEFRIVKADSAICWLASAGRGHFEETGKLIRIIGTLQDITGRKQAEEELANRTAELEAIFAAQNDIVLVYGVDMHVRRANPAFSMVCGFDPVGCHLKDIVHRVSCRWPDGRLFVWEEQPTPQALRGERVNGACLQITRGDGTETVVEVSSGPMLVGDRIAGSVTVWHDITQRQRAEEALFQLRTKHEDKLRQLADIIKKTLDSGMQEKADDIGNVVDNREYTKTSSSLALLTARELEVLTLIAEGNSSKAIADRLCISIHTVDRHRANIMEKLEIRKTAALVKYAISHGLVMR